MAAASAASCLVQGEVDERGRDGVALLQQDVGELHHGDEEARVQDDRRLHGLCFFSWLLRWARC